MESETGDSVWLPEFSNSRPKILQQLLELANQRVDNQVWYNIERQGNEAAKIVSKLIDAHMFREEPENYQGKIPIKFADFVIAELEKMVEEMRQRALSEREAVASIAITLEMNSDLSTKDRPETDKELRKRIRSVLGGSNGGQQGRRQYSNSHHKRRR